ncbi:MAG: hypothetical protein ACJ72E_01485 [Marmoricola sp.]
MATRLKIKDKGGRTTATGPDGTVLVDVTAVYQQPTTIDTPSGRYLLTPGEVTDATGNLVATATVTRSVLFPNASQLTLADGETFLCGAKNKVLRAGTWQAVPEAHPEQVWASSRHAGFGKILFSVEDELLAHPQHDLLIGLFVRNGVNHVTTQISLNQ